MAMRKPSADEFDVDLDVAGNTLTALRVPETKWSASNPSGRP